MVALIFSLFTYYIRAHSDVLQNWNILCEVLIQVAECRQVELIFHILMIPILVISSVDIIMIVEL